MASATVVTLGGEKHWKFVYKSGDASFEVYMPAPHISRKNEWDEFLFCDRKGFVLNEDDGYTAFTKSVAVLGFTHATQSVPTKADVNVCTKMTPELLEQLRQLPFSDVSTTKYLEPLKSSDFSFALFPTQGPSGTVNLSRWRQGTLQWETEEGKTEEIRVDNVFAFIPVRDRDKARPKAL